MDTYSVITLLGGLAFFLFGMSLMGDGLKKVAGNKLEIFLWKLSNTPLKGLLLGTFVTAIIQSSSATTVMVISFVNAGMMKVAQSAGVILGANIGTTMTGWLLTLSGLSGTSGIGRFFSTSTLVPLLAIIGIILYMFCSKLVQKHIGMILLGFSVLMFGMMTISNAVSPLKDNPEFTSILTMFSSPVLGLLAGILIAVIIQSASAGVGIVQALAVTGALTYSSCLPLILGINIGAFTPVLFAMIGSGKNGKRSALVYLIDNVFGMVIIYALYYPIKSIFGMPFMDNTADIVGIAVLNTTMRLIISAVLLPLHKLIMKIIYTLVKYDKSEDEDEAAINRLEDSLLRYPPLAIEQCRSAILSMARIAKENVFRAMSLQQNFDKSELALVLEKETLVDKYEDKLGSYVMKLSNSDLNTEQQQTAAKFLSAIGDFERLSDHAVNISEVETEIHEKKIVFSQQASEELSILTSCVTEIVSRSVEAFCNDDTDLALTIQPLEEVVDLLCDELKLRHVNRLQIGQCTINLGFVFNDLLTNYERISDHCNNLANYIVRLSSHIAGVHEYSSGSAKTEIFRVKFEEYKEKYYGQLKDSYAK